MARDLNKVQLTGRLGADPALRYTAQGSAITTFKVASNRTWRSSSGASHEDTEWFRVVAWDQLAEQCQRILARGAHIYVEGRLQTRQWSDDSGQPRTATEVVASEIILLDPAAMQPERNGIHPERNGAQSARSERRNPRVRPATPPPELHEGPANPVRLTEEDLPI